MKQKKLKNKGLHGKNRCGEFNCHGKKCLSQKSKLHEENLPDFRKSENAERISKKIEDAIEKANLKRDSLYIDIGNLPDPNVELYNKLNGKDEKFKNKDLSLKIRDDDDLSSFKTYKKILNNTNKSTTTYMLSKQILKNVLDTKEYENKSFNEKAMFWHDRIYDVINIIRHHNTLNEPSKKEESNSQFSSFLRMIDMDEILHDMKKDELSEFHQIINGNKKTQLFKHWHVIKNNGLKIKENNSEYDTIELLYKLSDIVRHQHDFFYKLQVRKNNLEKEMMEKKITINFKDVVLSVISEGKAGSFKPFYELANYDGNLSDFETFKYQFSKLVEPKFSTVIFKKWMVDAIEKYCNVKLPKRYKDYK